MSDFKDEGLEPSSAVEQTDDILGMSDEDILNMPFPEAPTDDEAPAEEVEEVAEELNPLDEEGEELTEEEETNEEEELDETPEETDVFNDGGESEVEEEFEEETEEDNPEDTDYKSQYEEVMAPLRANGKDVQVKSPEDLRRLAQMGIGFNAKMAEIKPLRKIGKMLENAGLLEEDKINFLIDLSKNNPDAINKLIHQSGINPLDLEPENSDGYKPNTYTVDDSQLDLDEALSDLERSPSGQKIIDVVSTKWDKASREILVSNPTMLRELETHMDNGIYEQVMAEVEREKLFGRIPAGVTDLQAYNHIGQQMNANGAFAKPAPSSAKPNKATKPKDTKRKTRRKAAASTRSKPTSTQAPPTDILGMSDEEFEKSLMNKYI